MSEVAGHGQFSIKTRGIASVVSQEERGEILDDAVKQYEEGRFELKKGSKTSGETPSAIVVKESWLGIPKEVKLEVNEYGSVLVEDAPFEG